MSSLVHHPEIANLVSALYPLARTVTVKSAYWITLPDGSSYYADNGAEWCHDCGRAMIRHLRKKDRKNRADYILDGGWTCEHDTPPHCAQCGVKLHASLTTHGALEELSHFADNPPPADNPSEAYEISEMLDALEWTTPDNSKFATEAIGIAQKLVAALSAPSAGAQGRSAA